MEPHTKRTNAMYVTDLKQYHLLVLMNIHSTHIIASDIISGFWSYLSIIVFLGNSYICARECFTTKEALHNPGSSYQVENRTHLWHLQNTIKYKIRTQLLCYSTEASLQKYSLEKMATTMYKLYLPLFSTLLHFPPNAMEMISSGF